MKAPEQNDEEAPVVAVDYNNVAETAKLLASKKVEVVISTIHIMGETASTAQVDLIKAAAQSGTVKRFIVSEWGIVHTEAYAPNCVPSVRCPFLFAPNTVINSSST